MKKRVFSGYVSFSLFVSLIIAIVFFGIFLSGKNTKEKKSTPNVLLIIIDALRPDHLSCYGYKRDTSVNIDKLAQEGIVFTRAVSASSSTISSVPSIMSSLYPDAHGIWDFGCLFSPSVNTLPRILKRNNYYTGIISGQLFPHLVYWGDFDTARMELDAKADKITDWAIDWLAKNKEKKFFLYLHYFDPHGPYKPPSAYDKIYINDRPRASDQEIPLLDNTRGGFGGIPGYQAQEGIKKANYYIAQYDAEIKFTDSQIARLMAYLEKAKLFSNTIIIITSDHGESMTEHDYYFDHGAYLYDNLIRVPLIIYYKQLTAAKKRIEIPVSLVDIMPTVLDIFNIKRKDKDMPDGISLLPLIMGRTDRRDGYIFSEYFEGGSRKFAVMGQGYKLIYDKKRNNYELYNLNEDPFEKLNVFLREKEKAQGLVAELFSFLKRRTASPRRRVFEVDQGTKDRLKSLGYLN